MKHLFRLFMLIFATIVLSGCEPQYTKEELQQMCIDDYVEKNLPELTYDVKDKYKTVEETYQEIINLYMWKYDCDLEVFDIFNSYMVRDDDITWDYVKNTDLEWNDVEKAFDIEYEKYKEILQTNFTDALIYILDVSNEDIHEKFNEIEDAIINEGFNHIEGIEYERRHKDYQEMFWKCSTEFMREMYYVLYPEEMLQGALENIYHPVDEEAVERTKVFLQEIGEYETYAKDVEDALAKFYKSNKFNGNASGPDFGIPEESDDDDYEVKPSKKEPKEEEKKEFPYDPYDVYDYWDPEDFYYDWEDDFDGYEDAEDYWYDAWDAIK